MKKFTRFYREISLAHMRAILIVCLLAFFFFPNFGGIKRTGDNMFLLSLNGKEIGMIGDTAKLPQLLREARLTLAEGREELILSEADFTVEGREVWFGKTDSDKEIVSHICEVLGADETEKLAPAYTVKIKEYLVNLQSAQDVTKLMQAALDKYQQNNEFQAEIVLDPTRELNVLTTFVRSSKEIREAAFAMPEAGVAAKLTEMTANTVSSGDKDFDDYEYGIVDLQYGDEVEIVESYVPQRAITPLADAIAYVTKDQEVNAVYKIQPGDTLSEIAITTNVPLDKLIEMNDSLEDENSVIKADQELIITMPEPELSIDRKEEIYSEEDYEAEIQYIDNDNWYTNESVVRQEPSAGHRKIAALVSYHNDKVVETEILKEEVTMEAVPKIVERGTKIPPTYIKPISGGRLSSQFGRRRAPTRGASSYHRGIDWATPVGTAVVASCGGVVERAGWGSGYGYVIYLRHSDGRQTRYGHLSKILVKPGQSVSQGQRIALSGNTGRSTGPHIHFELLINGSQVNPLEYLN